MLFAGLTAGGVTLLLTPLVRALAVRFGLVSKPVEDRWGRRAVARLGGIAICAGFLAATLCWVPIHQISAGMLIALCLALLLGLVDDVRRMPPYTKLLGQLLIGCLMVLAGIRIELVHWPWVAIPLSVLWFVLLMNAFNLLDNMDGLAAGVGAIAAGFCAIEAFWAGQSVVAVLAVSVCGASLGFLRHNFPPAKIYMGDSGSHFLGLSLASLSLLGSWRHSTQLLGVLAVPVMVLAVPIFDTCFVTLQRLAHRQHPVVGGTDHVSHRLAVLGLSVRQTVLVLYGVSLALGVVSLVSQHMSLWPSLAMWCVLWTGLLVVGQYLAQVKVYRLETATPAPSARREVAPQTVIGTMLLHKRRLLEVLMDFGLVAGVYVCAYLLRFEGMLNSELQRLILQSLPVVLLVQLLCIAGCGLYRGVWRYISVSDALTIVKAVTLGVALSSLALLFLWRFSGYSRAVFVIDWMLLLLAIAGSRLAERIFDEWVQRLGAQGVSTLLLGAGQTGARVLRMLREDRAVTRRVIGLLDDDARKHGERIYGISVLGGRGRLPELLELYRIGEVLVAINDPPGELLQYVRQCCEPQGTRWRVVAAGVTTSV